MKKAPAALLFLLLMLSFAFCACAEVSGLLQADYQYSSAGRVEAVRYLNRNGELTMADDLGYAQVIYTYKAGRLLQYEYQDDKGLPVNAASGFCRCVYTYEGKRVISQAYYTAGGAPAVGPEGFFEEKTAYTDGNIRSIVHYGADGRLVSSDNLYARYDAEYKANSKGSLYLIPGITAPTESPC